MRAVIAILSVSLIISGQALALTGYEALLDWNDLPRAKTGILAGLASSYDRTGGNRDYNYYQLPTGRQDSDVDPTIITELTGPGIITRFWMPHAGANAEMKMKLTIDGQIVIDTNSNTYLDGNYNYSTGPLTSTLVGGQVSYEPIIFTESLKIESNNLGSGGWAATHHYYQYSYQKLATADGLTAYSGTLTAEQQTARTAVVDMINNTGNHPAGPSPTSITLSTGGTTIPAGQTLSVASLTDSGTIQRLNLKMGGAEDAALDGLRLRIRYDGKPENAIDVPVAHFFGAGHGRAPYKSLPLGTDSPDGFYSYWPMPYDDGAIVELYNSTATAINIDSAAVEYEPGTIPLDAGRLHAVFSEESTTTGQTHHTLLDVQGRGHYVGNLLYLSRNGTDRAILEGDDIIYVDNDPAKTLFGTGLEDAYNGGYYYNHVIPQSDDDDEPYATSGIGPYHGLLLMEDGGYDPGFDHIRTDQYRWLIGDFVPFTDQITVLIENYQDRPDVLFGSTAFYYRIPDIPGDADHDGDVDIVDLGALAGNYGLAAEATWEMGDFNGDGAVDIVDLGTLAGNYGWGTAASTAFATDLADLPRVPEPTAILLLLAGALISRRTDRR